MIVYRKLLLRLVNTGLLCRQMTRFLGPQHTACHSPAKNPPKQGNNQTGFLLLYALIKTHSAIKATTTSPSTSQS